MTSWHEYRQYELENGGMDDPPYCPRCGAYTASGVYCEKCRDAEPGEEEPGDVCHCGLPEEDHRHGGAAEHNFIPKRDSRVFTHCNVCGRKLHTDEEDRIGMCEVCGNL
jgi:predicted RNA-binding Zn-ribbon protein involved in translation (DUF1610 family)